MSESNDATTFRPISAAECTVSTGTFSALISYSASAKYADGETGLLYYGYRYYQTGTAQWVSRDPSSDVAFQKQRLSRRLRKELSRNLLATQAPYLFVTGNPVNNTDAIGLITWSQCDCCLSAAEKADVQFYIAQAWHKLYLVKNDDWDDLPNNLTSGMGDSLLSHLLDATVFCQPRFAPLCLVSDAMGLPGFGIFLCCSKIKSNSPLKPLYWIATMIIHEEVHVLGKVGHDDPDNPYNWASWLMFDL
jgi:RHS repeat-associated protein